MLALKRITPMARKPTTTRKQASLENSQRLAQEACDAIESFYTGIGETPPARVMHEYKTLKSSQRV